MTINKTATAVAWCEFHEKLLYASRKEARKVARRHPEHKSPYRCEAQPHLWHIGNLPATVVSGERSRDDIRGRRMPA